MTLEINKLTSLIIIDDTIENKSRVVLCSYILIAPKADVL